MKRRQAIPMSFRMNKKQRRYGVCSYSSHVNDGIDFKPKPHELPGILAYMDELERREAPEAKMKPLKHADNESLCQQWCVDDCWAARHEAERLQDPMEVPLVTGKCLLDCSLCLYAERHKRDDANWIPQQTDVQYHHWITR